LRIENRVLPGIVNLVACFMAGRIAGLLAARWEGLGLVTVGAPSYKEAYSAILIDD
jgi:hypothetical protein